MAFYVGEQFADSWTIVNNANVPVDGLEWSTELNEDPNEDPIAFTVEGEGDGVYQILWDITVPGNHVVQLVATTPVDGVYPRVLIELNADEMPDEDAVVVEAAEGISLQDLRVKVAGRLRDWVQATATAAGDTSSFVDSVNFVESDKFYRGADLIFVGGTLANRNLVRRITSSDYESTSVSFTPDLPSPVAEGDVAHIFNTKGGAGFRIYEYDNAINYAINVARPANDYFVYEVLDDVFDRDVGTVGIPDVFDAVSGVRFLWSDGKWYDVAPAFASNRDGWFLDHARREIIIGEPTNWTMDGRQVLLYGYAQHPELTAPDQRTMMDVGWIVATAAHYLLASRRNAQDYGLIGLLKNESDILYAKMAATVHLPNTVRIR